MRKQIKWMDGEEERALVLDNTFTWMVYYKEAFGRDIVPDLAPILNSVIKAFFAVFSAVDIDKVVKIAISKQKDKKKDKTEADRTSAIMNEIVQKVDPDDITEVIIEATAIESVTFLQIMWALAKCADDSIDEFFEWTKTTSGMTPDFLVSEVFDLVLKGWITENPLVKRLLEETKEPKKK